MALSRRHETDEYLIDACQLEPGSRVLDVGCGDGRLARRFAAIGSRVVGVDARAELIAAADGEGGATYHVMDESALRYDAPLVGAGFDVVCCHFSIVGDAPSRLLASLATRLAPNGRLLIHAVHPMVAAANDYRDGWREPYAEAPTGSLVATAPWFFRTMESWIRVIREGELSVYRLREPRDADGRVRSVLFECRSLA